MADLGRSEGKNNNVVTSSSKVVTESTTMVGSTNDNISIIDARDFWLGCNEDECAGNGLLLPVDGLSPIDDFERIFESDLIWLLNDDQLSDINNKNNNNDNIDQRTASDGKTGKASKNKPRKSEKKRRGGEAGDSKGGGNSNDLIYDKTMFNTIFGEFSTALTARRSANGLSLHGGSSSSRHNKGNNNDNDLIINKVGEGNETNFNDSSNNNKDSNATTTIENNTTGNHPEKMSKKRKSEDNLEGMLQDTGNGALPHPLSSASSKEGTSASGRHDRMKSEMQSTAVNIQDFKRTTKNRKEQQRNEKLSEQIFYIGKMMMPLEEKESNKNKSKNSILESAKTCILELQQKNSLLSQQLSQTSCRINSSLPLVNEVAQSTFVPCLLDPSSAAKYSSSRETSATAQKTNKIKCYSLTNSDYHELFLATPIPWALSDIEGRIIDCNTSFERTSGYSRAELLSYTICNLVPNADLQSTFSALAWLLDASNPSVPIQSSTSSSRDASSTPSSERTGSITLNAQLSRSMTSNRSSADNTTSDRHFNLVISLVRKVADFSPQYFHLLLLPTLPPKTKQN